MNKEELEIEEKIKAFDKKSISGKRMSTIEYIKYTQRTYNAFRIEKYKLTQELKKIQDRLHVVENSLQAEKENIEQVLRNVPEGNAAKYFEAIREVNGEADAMAYAATIPDSIIKMKAKKK